MRIMTTKKATACVSLAVAGILALSACGSIVRMILQVRPRLLLHQVHLVLLVPQEAPTL